MVAPVTFSTLIGGGGSGSSSAGNDGAASASTAPVRTITPNLFMAGLLGTPLPLSHRRTARGHCLNGPRQRTVQGDFGHGLPLVRSITTSRWFLPPGTVNVRAALSLVVSAPAASKW